MSCKVSRPSNYFLSSQGLLVPTATEDIYVVTRPEFYGGVIQGLSVESKDVEGMSTEKMFSPVIPLDAPPSVVKHSRVRWFGTPPCAWFTQQTTTGPTSVSRGGRVEWERFGRGLGDMGRITYRLRTERRERSI